MVDWSELPIDVVELITSFLPLADTHRFSAVCQNWWSVTKEKRYCPVSQLPWLVLSDDGTGRWRIFNTSEKKHYHFDIPELRDAFIVGSSFGWLFAVGPRLDAYLVNPFSGAKFALPSLPHYCVKLRPEKLYEYAERDEHSYWPLNDDCFEYVQHLLVRRAVLSSDPSRCTDFVVFILLAGEYRLAFYKPGDTTWMVFDSKQFVHDIVCSNGKFHAILDRHVLATIDIDPEPKIRRRDHLRLGYKTCWSTYLVDYSGTSLLYVSQLIRVNDIGNPQGRTKKFRVYEVDKESYKIRELKDIDGHALFLGKNYSIVVRASDFNGCRANSIYFCDATYGWPEKKDGYYDMGVYNLEDKSIGTFYPRDIYHPPQSCPIWLVPYPS